MLLLLLMLSHRLLLVVISLTYARTGCILTILHRRPLPSRCDAGSQHDALWELRSCHLTHLGLRALKERIPSVSPLLKDMSMHVSRCTYSVATYSRYSYFPPACHGGVPSG